MNKPDKILLLLLLAAAGAAYLLYGWGNRMKEERNTYRGNTEALLADVTQVRVDSSMMASTIQVLNLSLEEYKKYRREDAELIKKLGIRVKDLQAAATHGIEVDAPIDAAVRDSAIICDTVKIIVKAVKMETPYIRMDAVIEDNRLKGEIHLPVHLRQAFWVEYRRRFLWWRWKVKAIRQTITSDNPYVEIKYTEFINVKK